MKLSKGCSQELGKKEPIQLEKDIPFYKKQIRIVLGANGTIDRRNR